MRLTEGLDSGPVALQERGRDRARTTTTARSSTRLAELGGELLGRARSTSASAGELELTEQDEAGATYAEKIEPEDRRLDPGRPAVELERVGPGAEPPHRRLPRARGRRAARRPRGGRRGRRARRRRARAPADGALLLGCGDGVLRLTWSSRPARGRWRPTPTCAGHPAPRRAVTRAWAGSSPARRAAFEVAAADVRGGRVGRPRPALGGRAPRPLGSRAGSLGGSPTARCSGAGRATPSSTASPKRPGDGSTRRCARPCASACTSCSSPGRPPTTRRSTRRSSWPSRASRPRGRGEGEGGSGLVNAVLRRASRERGELLGLLDDSTPGGRRGRPLLSGVAGDDVVGGARPRRRPCRDGGDERSGRGCASGSTRCDPRRSRPRRVCESRASTSRPGAASDLLDPVTAIVIAGGDADRRRPGRCGRAGPAVARRRRRWSPLLDPQPGERVLDLCAGPGIKATPDRRGERRRGRDRLGRARRAARSRS